MKKNIFRILICLCLSLFLLVSAAQSQEAIVLPVKGAIDKGLAAFLKRNIDEYTAAGETELFILEIDTPGGRLDAALEISNAILSTPVPVIAYINKEAISAGALIAISCSRIVMAPGATLGDVQPQPTTEKSVSFVRAKMRSLAERYNRDPEIAAAMVDKDISIEGVVSEDQLLTLTTQEALDLNYAQFQSASIADILNEIDKADLNVEYVSLHPAEKIARFITHPVISSMLLSLGFLGLLFELRMPGWGISGTFGLICILLFFGGHMIAGFATGGALLVFLLGLVLIAVEIFVIPGFGVAGIAGIAAVIFSLFLVFEDIGKALQVLLPAILVAVAGTLYFLFTFQNSWIIKRITRSEPAEEDKYIPPEELSNLVGRKGIALSPLRPAGRVTIDDKNYSVISDGIFIEKGTPIEISKVSGNNIYVKPVKSNKTDNIKGENNG